MTYRRWPYRVAYRVKGGEPDRIHGVKLCKDEIEAVAQARLILGQVIRPVDAYQDWDEIECTWIERLNGDEWEKVDDNICVSCGLDLATPGEVVDEYLLCHSCYCVKMDTGKR